MWRIGDDTWDGWTFPHPDPNSEWPQGLRQGFDKLAQWYPYAMPGNWPDADMLPFGALFSPHPGWGDARQSRLTPDEERSQFTLWAIARSPPDSGRQPDGNRRFHEVADHQAECYRGQSNSAGKPSGRRFAPHGFEQARVGAASAGSQKKPSRFLAFFNLDDKAGRSACHMETTWIARRQTLCTRSLAEHHFTSRQSAQRCFARSRQRPLSR